MKKALKTYFSFLSVLILCGLANFNANSIITNDTISVDNIIDDTASSSLVLNFETSSYPSYKTPSEHSNHSLLFDVVDPQKIEEFEGHLSSNLQSNGDFETDFSRIQYLKNSSYTLKERSMRFIYNCTKPSSELLVRLQVYII